MYLLYGMTLYEYNLLSEKEKWKMINRYGASVAVKHELFNRYELFQLFSFYVEIKFDHNRSFENGRSFPVEKLPEMYLERIDISKLIPA